MLPTAAAFFRPSLTTFDLQESSEYISLTLSGQLFIPCNLSCILTFYPNNDTATTTNNTIQTTIPVDSVTNESSLTLNFSSTARDYYSSSLYFSISIATHEFQSTPTSLISISQPQNPPIPVEDSDIELEPSNYIIVPFNPKPFSSGLFTLSIPTVVIAVVVIFVIGIIGGIILFFYVCSISNGYRLAGEDEHRMADDDTSL